MPVQPLEVPTFGGLNLTTDSTDLGFTGAIDCLNVESGRPAGALRTRDGVVKFTAATPSNPLTSLTNASSGHLLAYRTAGPRAFQAFTLSSGIVAATSGTIAATSFNMVEFSTPAAGNIVYMPVGSDYTHITKWTGSAFADVSVGYTGQFVGKTPWDNRLILAGDAGGSGAGYQSRVRFSDAGAPTTFSANNYVDLSPGDGEYISGVVNYANQMFVFKQSKFYVFYGTSTAADGTPVFNYRTVDTGIGVYYYGGAVASPNGVYFGAQDGIYVTTGGAPQKISGDLNPLFGIGSLPGTLTAPTTTILPFSVQWLNGRLFVAAGGSPMITLMFDGSSWWVWSVPSSRLGVAPIDGSKVLFVSNHATQELYYLSMGTTTDDGSAIASRYRTGFQELAAGRQATMRELVLEGSGTVGVSVSHDLATSVPTATSVAINSTSGRGRFRKAVRGRTFSISLAATSGAWTVNRVTPLIRNARYAGSDAKQ